MSRNRSELSELIVGSSGKIGAALARKIPEARTTTRKELDLLKLEEADSAIFDVDVIYLCAGANGAYRCEGKPESFTVNVDAPVAIARLADSYGAFLVYIGSQSVEWQDGAYPRQKLAAECQLSGLDHVAIVRAGRVLDSNVDDLCETMMRVGRDRIAGVTRWGSDDTTYDGRRISR